jgi:HD-like signal output (HDOD) protein
MRDPHREVWQTLSAESGEEALELLDQHRVDVVVTGMRMPGMDGVDFLARVKEKDPSIGRLVLSAQSDEEAALRATSVAHRYLLKPCGAGLLSSVLQGMLMLRDMMGDSRLGELVGELGALPSLSEHVRALVDECARPNADIQFAATVIERDPAMSAKILQLVNSAFFGLPREVHSIRSAVTLLGLKTVTTLALSTYAFAAFEASDLHPVARRAASTSMDVATMARDFANALGFERDECDDAFQAGLLHDVGILALAVRRPMEFQCCVEASAEAPWKRHEFEEQILGGHHGAIGGYLLGLWGLSEMVVEAVSFHHEVALNVGESKGIGFCVFMANLVDEFGADVDLGAVHPELQADESALMLLERVRQDLSPAA